MVAVFKNAHAVSSGDEHSDRVEPRLAQTRDDQQDIALSSPSLVDRPSRGSQVEKSSKRAVKIPTNAPFPFQDEEDLQGEGESSSSSHTAGMTHEPLDVNNPIDLDEYFDSRCESVQQLNWKMVLKAWIKEIEPRKQTTYPYNKKPPEENDHPGGPPGIPHKEPDHSTKPRKTCLRLLTAH